MSKTTQRSSVTGEVLKTTKERIKTGVREPVKRNGEIQYRKDGNPRTREIVITKTRTELIAAVRSGQPGRNTLRTGNHAADDHNAWRETKRQREREAALEAMRQEREREIREVDKPQPQQRHARKRNRHQG